MALRAQEPLPAAAVEAVITTDLGTFRMEFYADKAPNPDFSRTL